MIQVEMKDGSVHNVRKLLTAPAVVDPKVLERLRQQVATGEVTGVRASHYSTWVNKGSVGGNLKLSKGFAKDYVQVGLSLAPNKESGYSVCPNTTEGCTRACIYNGEMANALPNIKPSQIGKTLALFRNRTEFDRMLAEELAYYYARHGDKLVCRLNVYSDLPWERMTPWLFERFRDVIFYDYTKVPARMGRFLDGDFPLNYHLTFSRSENNEDACRHVLALGGNIAAVFPLGQFPEFYMDVPVINGDEHDLRFLDPRPAVVGLKAKNRFGKSDKTGFVVRPFMLSLPVVEEKSDVSQDHL